MAMRDQRDKWCKEHPDATIQEAYEAGYWQECHNWVTGRRH